jgi:LacI family transcriptional regulator
MRATIRQVADRAGVSRTTVSNVLLGRQGIVSADKVEAVLRAVREMEYVPVRPTLQNRRVQTRIIAVPMDDPTRLKWDFHNSTYRGVCEGAVKHRYDVLNLLRPNPDWALDRKEVQFLDQRGDGIIFALPDQGERQDTYEMLVRHQIPAVVCYRRDVPDGIAWVDPDNKAAIYGAVAHLMDHGHRRIAYLTSDMPQFDVADRSRYFPEAIHHNGLGECAQWIINRGDVAASSELVRHIIAMGATAVVCFHDGIALELWEAMAAGGLRVPEDLSLVGVDDEPASRVRGLTTMGFSCAEVGRRAVDSLAACIQGESPAQCSYVIPVQLCDRSSVKTIHS